MSKQFFSAAKLLKLIKEENCTIADIVIMAESELTARTKDEIKNNMKKRLEIMKESIHKGLKIKQSVSGMITKEAKLMSDKIDDNNMVGGKLIVKAAGYALAVMSCNASLGRIVAAPTAGASGIIPGIIFAYLEEKNLPFEKGVEAILTASGIGLIIGHNSTFSAAQAGCQAEIGTASAMGAAALSAMRGMNAEDCVAAAALALKNMLGLACDPVGGLVEVPCVKRNAFGVSHAFMASDLVYAGIKSIIPFDEIIMAMNDIARSMSVRIRETAQGGLAITPTGKKIGCKFIKKAN
jgi:L-serine dehydratase